MILKVIFANSVDPDQTAPSDQGPHCLPVCKNRFEESARIFSRRHKQTTFSDAVFLGALRVNICMLQTYNVLRENTLALGQAGIKRTAEKHSMFSYWSV